MRILMLSTTADGAIWAASLARRLSEMGLDIFVVLPKEKGMMEGEWRLGALSIEYIDLSIRKRQALRIKEKVNNLRLHINDTNPDIVHCFSLDAAIISRFALRHNQRISTIFHVPGPLHLENRVTRFLDSGTARNNDYWVASSKYTYNIYKEMNIDKRKLFLSYFGFDVRYVEGFKDINKKSNVLLRDKYKLPRDDILLLNGNYFYPPKYYLGKIRGVKNHESLIKSTKYLKKKRKDISLVLVGEQWGTRTYYEKYLKTIARKCSKEKIFFLGYLDHEELLNLYNAADIIVHTPISENCGGVVEPALLEKPIIASNVGGLKEIIKNDYSGWVTASENAKDIAEKVLEVAVKRDEWREKAMIAKKIVEELFDIDRTSKEVYEILRFITGESKEKPILIETPLWNVS